MSNTPPHRQLITAPGGRLPLLILLSAVLFFRPQQCGTVAAGPDPLIQLPSGGAAPGDDDGDGDGGVKLGSKKFFSVQDYGAVGNGIADDTRAFRHAWRATCSSTTQKSVLTIPENQRYLVRPMNFAGPCSTNVTLRILGSILAHRRPFLWPKQTPQRWLYFRGINHLSVRGRGVGMINGMGRKLWFVACRSGRRTPLCQRPTDISALVFEGCRHLKVRNMTLLNNPGSHLALSNCYHVKASGLKIIAPSLKADGININGSRTVYVQNSRIATGEKCLSVATGSSKVRIRNVACGTGHGIGIGSLGKSNSWAKVTDVRVEGALLSNTKAGLWIKTWQGGHGFASEISFQNVIMENVANPIVIDQYHCDDQETCGNRTSAVEVRKVSFVNIVGTSATATAASFSCSDTFPCRGVLLQDIQLSSESGGKTTSYCWRAAGFSTGIVDPPSCLAAEDDYPVMQTVPPSLALLSSA